MNTIESQYRLQGINAHALYGFLITVCLVFRVNFCGEIFAQPIQNMSHISLLRPLAASGQAKWAAHTEKFEMWKALYSSRPSFSPFTTDLDPCFALQQMPPSAPNLLSPANGATNQPLFTTLQWSAVQGATLYDLHVSGDPVFFTTVSRDSTIAPTVTSRRIGEIFPGTTIHWRVRAINAAGAGAWSPGWSFTAMRITSVQQSNTAASGFSLSPNPANDEVHVKFTLSRAGRIKLSLFNVLGQEIATLLDAEFPAGEHSQPFLISSAINTQNISNQALFVRLQTPMFFATQAVQVIR